MGDTSWDYTYTCPECNTTHLMHKIKSLVGISPYNIYAVICPECRHKERWKASMNPHGRKCTICGKFKDWGSYGGLSLEKKNASCKECKNKKEAEKRGKVYKPPKKVDLEGRECTSCGTYKSYDHFGVNSSRNTTGHREVCKSCEKIKREENIDKIRIQKNEQAKSRRRKDPNVKVKGLLRSRLSIALNSQDATKFHHTMDMLGCSPAECIAHLDDNPHNYLFDDVSPKGLNVDHILPCASFDLTQELNQLICFNYRNLQLMWWKDNNEKNDTLPPNWQEIHDSIKTEVLKLHPHLEG